MRAKRADGGVASRLLLFASTPQSRLTPCQLPLTGAPFGCGTSSNPKAVPACGESGTKCRKGNGLEMLTAASYSPPQLRLRSAAPPHAVAPFGCPPTEKSPIGALFIACLFSLILISSRSRCLCRGQTGPRRGHSPRAGSCCRNSRGNSSRSSSRSRGRSPWGRCWSGTW